MPEWMKAPWLQQTWASIAPHVPAIALSLGILVGGWIVAIILRSITFAALKRTTIDDRIAEALGVRVEDDRVERGVAKFVYWVALAFVIVAFLERLEVTAVTTPIVGALEGLSSALPSILKALLIGLVGYLAATGVRRAIVAVLDRTALVSRIEKWSGLEHDEEPEKTKKKRKKRKKEADEPASASETIGSIAFWVIIVLTAIPVLEALKIGVLAAPLSNAITVVSTYLPKVLGAALLAALGYFLGRAARAVITTVVNKVGVDDALRRLGLAGLFGEQTAGSILGNLAMAFILLHFAISAVGRLDIEEISNPLGTILTQIYAFLPRLLVGALLLALGIAVARISSRFVRGLLAAVGFNTLMAHIGLYEANEDAKRQQEESKKLLEARLEGEAAVDEGSVDPLVAGDTQLKTPADIGGVVVAAVIVLLFLRQALETMGLAGLAAMFDSLIGYLPDVLVAAVVLAAGMWAGGWAKQRLADVTAGTEDRLVRALPVIVHGAIVTIAAMIALQQLGVGNQIIAIAFTLVLGSVCLALALAFGLGGRVVASEILAKEYEKRSD